MANSIVFYLFIIFHLYLHAFVNARSRKRLFQDALFFDGFAFRHRERTKKIGLFLFFSGAALSLHVRSKESRLSNGSDWHRALFSQPPLPLVCVQSARDEVGSVAGMCASARDETGSVASRMCASAIERS